MWAQQGIKSGPLGIDQAALVSLSLEDGGIFSMVGGVGSYDANQWNRDIHPHTAGSTFKPFVYHPKNFDGLHVCMLCQSQTGKHAFAPLAVSLIRTIPIYEDGDLFHAARKQLSYIVKQEIEKEARNDAALQHLPRFYEGLVRIRFCFNRR